MKVPANEKRGYMARNIVMGYPATSTREDFAVRPVTAVTDPENTTHLVLHPSHR